MQQQLAVAVATDRKKAIMIEQLDKVYLYLLLGLCLLINITVPFSIAKGRGVEVLGLNLYDVYRRNRVFAWLQNFGMQTIPERGENLCKAYSRT